MAWLGIDVLDRHITLVHFDDMTPEHALAVDNICCELTQSVKRPPVGVFGDPVMVGRYKNVKAIRVNSPYLLKFQAKLVEELESFSVPYSKQFGSFMPHVSRPTIKMATGLHVPFTNYLDFHWKEQGDISYEFGVQ